MKAIISGGGTGGHIFPALSIADALKKADPSTEILFVGAEGRMEMEKVPAAGYTIKGLPIAGLQRRSILKNLMLPFKVIKSCLMAGRIIKEFKPDIAIGVGGYASAPLLWSAHIKGIPCIIQEQNSFAGLTNRILGRKVQRICVAYPGMDRFFPAGKIVLTGNPIRPGFGPSTPDSRTEGSRFYGLDPAKRHILILGGSLGCRTLNDSMKRWIEEGCPGGEGVEILWQCGKYYKAGIDEFMAGRNLPDIHYSPFISRMDLAYAGADLVISRSGASSISEICVCAKPAVFVPSPNVAEDHQTFNARSLSDRGAARLVKDAEARDVLMKEALGLVRDDAALKEIGLKCSEMGIDDAADRIVREIYKVLGKGKTMKNAYFIGIGGIGMSAIARYYNSKGWIVSGYDRTPSPLTAELEKEGIKVHYEDRPDMMPSDKDNTIVVYTPAIPENLAELRKAMDTGYKVVKRSRMLGEISEGMHCLAVAGTHGKTTTSTLLGHIFKNSGRGCNAFLGGISKNYDTNLLLADNDIFVAEADEFDRSFLQLHPQVAVITAMDADHLDIYGDAEHVREAFRAFAGQVSGTLIAKTGLPLKAEDTPARLLRYSLDDASADFYASDLKCDEYGHYTFTLNYPAGVCGEGKCCDGAGRIEDCRCGVPGIINVENSVGAAAAALSFGVAADEVKKAIECYKGVKRRFDIHYNDGKTVYVDDYAHHPEELRAAIRSIRGMFPARELTAVFQPHLYTRTRDFAPQFAEVLSEVDRLILLDIYPAREEPIEGVTSRIILDAATAGRKEIIAKDKLVETLREARGGIIVSFGAGDIDRLVPAITRMLNDAQ